MLKASHEAAAVPQSKHKPTKFMCKQRATLLTVLHQCIAAAGSACPISRKILGYVETVLHGSHHLYVYSKLHVAVCSLMHTTAPGGEMIILLTVSNA